MVGRAFACLDNLMDVRQIDKRLTGHSTNLRIALAAMDWERVRVIQDLVDALLDERQIATKWTSPTGG